MSQRKYKNPVNNHFIYNDEIRKSTCKVCYFDMAGRHSENLMRHLKRKHPATYTQVMLEKQRRRSTNPTKSGSDAAGPLSAMFKFETEPHKLFIKSTAISEAYPNDNEENSSNQTANGQFEDVYIGKTELDVEQGQSPGQLNDSSESLSYRNDHKIDQNRYIITDLPQSSSTSAVVANAVASAAASVTSAKIMPIGDTISAPITMPNPDDAFFLQYLGNKFTKYSANTKNTVQFHINRILYKADMGCYDNVDCSKLSDAD